MIPSEPWHLRGDYVVSVFLVRVSELPAEVREHAPARARVLSIAGRALVGVAAVRYTPGGVLAYDELLVAVPVVERGRIAVTIPQIWVTTPPARDGGRELWSIPKGLMTVRRRVRGTTWDASYRTGDAEIATVTAAVNGGNLGRWTLPLPTAQRLEGREITSHNTVRGVLAFVRARWTFRGDLAWLAGRRSLASLTIARAAVVFGLRVRR